jgi:hypothetical protein
LPVGRRKAKDTLVAHSSMAALVTSFRHGLLVFLTKRFVGIWRKNLSLIFCAKRKVFCLWMVKFCSDHKTYQQRKKLQVASSSTKVAIINQLLVHGIVDYDEKIVSTYIQLCVKQKVFI